MFTTVAVLAAQDSRGSVGIFSCDNSSPVGAAAGWLRVWLHNESELRLRQRKRPLQHQWLQRPFAVVYLSAQGAG
ncbi:hypothetical protein CCHOA_04445 [Corynebacterium choanae]|uniref:Uncharacterized protein n=1 Tax=Corynebacterium choanae TaxID=1862358 RepID=A0A3G6J5H6_9CORY|nr:hypothetical protein CCHOA_04445 [Corynebacterium choanae]